MDTADKKHFREWFGKKYGVQNAIDYADSFTEEIAIEYASHFKTVELTDIDFIKWYSGMSEERILKAYKRFKSEMVEPYRLERPVEDGIAGTELGAVEPDVTPYASGTVSAGFDGTVDPEKQETLCSHNVIDLNKHGDFYCKICLARL